MNNTLQLKETPEGTPNILPTDFVIHKQLHAIIVGGSTVVQLAVLKLNNVMCVIKLAIFQEYAIIDSKMLVEGVGIQQM